jgi:hypothetical protein
MEIAAWELWVRSTWLHKFVVQYEPWVWPTCEIIHYLGLSLLLGTVGLFDLRVLGVAKGIPLQAIHRLIPWGIAGYILGLIASALYDWPTGAVIVVASGGLTWRAVDQGVFAPGTGPTYEPWHLDLSSGGPMSLVSAAILAANVHDSQPWAFRVAPERIDLFPATERSIGVQKPPDQVGDELVAAGATLFTVGFGGPYHDLGLLKDWIAWRDDRA